MKKEGLYRKLIVLCIIIAVGIAVCVGLAKKYGVLNLAKGSDNVAEESIVKPEEPIDETIEETIEETIDETIDETAAVSESASNDSDMDEAEQAENADYTESTNHTENMVSGSENLSSKVVIGSEADEQNQSVSFPCEVPGYDLVIEKLAPYSGAFVEDGTNREFSDMAMILVHNKSELAIEYAEITIHYGQECLQFYLTALPGGESAVVQEINQRPVLPGTIDQCEVTVVQREKMEMSEGQITVTENEDGTLKVENLTQNTISSARIFYKYYLSEESVYLGGVAFTVKLTELEPGEKRTIQPSHYHMGMSRIVRVSIY